MIEIDVIVIWLTSRDLGPFHKNLKITIHTWDIFILLEKHHQCHCMQTNYSYDYVYPLLEFIYVRKQS